MADQHMTNTPEDLAKEKTRAGGKYNSGVTSEDPATKEKIEKKAALNDEQPAASKEQQMPPAHGKEKQDS